MHLVLEGGPVNLPAEVLIPVDHPVDHPVQASGSSVGLSTYRSIDEGYHQ